MQNIKKILFAALLISGSIIASHGVAEAASCASRARTVAADSGGRVLSVSSFQRGGTTMCRITILVKSRDGGPARKKTITVRK